MKITSALAALALAGGVALSANAADTYQNPLFSADGMTGYGVDARPALHNGKAGLQVIADPDHKNIDEGGCDNCTVMLVDGIDFGDGVIEIELSGDRSPGVDPANRGFVGIVFRAAADGSSYEGVYFRPRNAIETSQVRRNFTVQYFSYPDHYWRALREAAPGMYESWAPVQPGAWTRMRVEVSGATAHVYVDDIDIPVLVVNDLKLGADRRGTVGLFTEPNQDAYFRDLKVTALPAARGED